MASTDSRLLSGGPGVSTDDGGDGDAASRPPPGKRARAAERETATAAHSTPGRLPRADPLRAHGFALTRVDGLPPRHLAGPLGVRLADLVTGDPHTALVR
jgi:hypothetical protein